MHNSMTALRRWICFIATLACSLAFSFPAHADPAGRIGRVAWLSGTVNLYNPDTGESFPVPLNQPLTSGDVLTAEPNSRTEIQIGSMTIRLDADSELELAQINDDKVELKLKNGHVLAKLPVGDAINDFSLETPDGRFTVRETGVYRFDSDDNSSTATVYYGTAHFSSDDLEQDVRAGQSRQFWYDNDRLRARTINLVNDGFTQWSADRDRRPASTTYTRYVSPEMTGAEDLDNYGNWSNDPEYGAIWVPRNVDRDWAPYRSGHWVWVAPWGWNWVGAEPWGFAPFHYGRWVHRHGVWGWVPGTRVVRPVYAPAMVAWVGTPSVGVSIRIGSAPSVGWFPLAPREVYVPAYRTSVNYVRNVNITHVTRITNITTVVERPDEAVRHVRYANRDLPHAMTVVPKDVLEHRRPVAQAMLATTDRRALRDQPVQVAAPVAAPIVAPTAALRPGPERVDGRGRGEPFGRDFRRRDNPPQDRQPADGSGMNRDRDARNTQDARVATPFAGAPAPTATVTSTPPRGERPLPDVQRPGMRPQGETAQPSVATARPDSAPQAPALATVPTAAPTSGGSLQRNDNPRDDGRRPFGRRPDPGMETAPQLSRDTVPPMIATQPATSPAPANVQPRNNGAPVEERRGRFMPRAEPASTPTVQGARDTAPAIVAPQRNDRPIPEAPRMAPPPRPEPQPAPQAAPQIQQAPAAPRMRELTPPQAPQRVERPMPEVQRAAPPPRGDAPQMQQGGNRPAEMQAPRRDDRRNDDPNEEELKKRRRAAEQRP